MFTEDLMAHIVKCTNEYYKSTTTFNLRAKKKYEKSWVDVTTSEMYRFFATALLMAHVKKLKYTDYWSIDCLIATESFRKIMPRDRHRAILNFLYFYDSSVANTRDPLYKIRRIIDELQRSFSRCFYPFRNLCIDESLMLFKGRLSFKQFIPTKRNRFGIKSFVLCDCLTGYILNFIVYTGKTTDSNGQSNDNLGKSGSDTLKTIS